MTKLKQKKEFIEPTRGIRYRIPDSFLESEEIKRMKDAKDRHKWDSYLHLKPNDNNPNQIGYEVYSVVFAALFSPPPISLINLEKTRKLLKDVESFPTEDQMRIADKKASENINTFLFMKEYEKGYDEGIKYFDSNFKVTSEVIYGNNGLLYERTLHRHFYHSKFESNWNEGWNYWISGVPIVVSFETFYKYGYYAGIISKVNEVKKLHPIVFTNFAECKKSTSKHETKPEIIKPESRLSISQAALLHVYEGRNVTRENANELIVDYGYESGDKLYQKYTRFRERLNRINPEDTPLKTINKIKLIESVIPHLSPNASTMATDELNTLKSKEKEYQPI